MEDRVVPDASPIASWGVNSQHTAISSVASQSLEAIHWQTPVDNFPSSRFAHYGSPLITLANTVIYPYKTTVAGDFQVVARNGNDGSLLWSETTDYAPSGYNWYPAYQPVYVPATGRLYFPGANGSLYYRDNVDSATGTKTQVTVFGNTGNVTITGLAADSAGNIFFGYRNGSNGGIARVTPAGAVTTVAASAAAGDANIDFPQYNSNFALSNDEQTLYVTVRDADTNYRGRLLGLNSTTLATQYNSGILKDPRNGGANNAGILNDSTASPMVAPDGRIFLGVFGSPYNGSRGWMLQFSGDLATQYTPGGFGWDTTASIVPASMVPQYNGASEYLIFTKYNNYYGISDGGDGSNMIAVLDPNDTEVEFHPSSNGLLVMKRVLFQVGPTPDWDNPDVPTAVREWCINFGTVDPATDSVIVNSADGKFYRWHLPTDTLTEEIQLTSGIGQPYTMTVVGVDGTIYGIQIGTLFAMGQTPRLSIDDVSITEGTGGSQNATITVSLNYPRTQTITVDYATADGTATAGADYTNTFGTLTFNPGEKTKTITVPLMTDALDEFDETFFINLSSASNAVILDSQGQVTVVDDDPLPLLSINNVSANEGNSDFTDFVFTVSLSAASGRTVTVNYTTANGGAEEPDDYLTASGTLTFDPGQTSRMITVQVVGETTFENSEGFFVNLSGPTNATIADSQGLGTIINDDNVPSLSIDDVIVTEGDVASFTVTLSNASAQTVTVAYDTADGSAEDPDDYQGASGTLTFDPDETTKTVIVTTYADELNEETETFFVNLSNPTNAFVAIGAGQGSILDTDAVPSLSIDDVALFEGAADMTAFVFTVSLSAASGRVVTVDYDVVDGTAEDASDYQDAAGTVTFDIGQMTQTITVLVNGDLTNEPDETFFVNLSSPDGAALADGQGQGTIVDDDTLVLSIDNVSLIEGTGVTTAYVFTVSLSTPSSQTVTVQYDTADGAATAASGDYESVSDILSFDPGETTATITVLVDGDTTNEIDETFFVNLSNPSGGTIGAGQGQGVGTIQNDDVVSSLTVSDFATVEGDYNVGTVNVYVLLSAPSGQTVTVHYETFNGTASSTSATRDYIDIFGDLTYEPGQTVQSFELSIIGDTIDELDETIIVRLSDPVNATLGDGEAIVTITDDDTAYVTITDATIIEGNSGVTEAQLTVELSVPSDRTITVDWQTQDATAKLDLDYVHGSGMLIFGAGQTSKLITVQAVGEAIDELDEEFKVALSNATGGAVLPYYAKAHIYITDDDTAGVGISDVAMAEGQSGPTAFEFTVFLSNPSDRTVSVDYTTAEGSALPGSDYQVTSGTLSFDPGETSKTFSVPVSGDPDPEVDENFFVNLSGLTGGAVMDDAQGQATIVNDDFPRTVSVGSVAVLEGNRDTKTFIFPVNLSEASNQTITVQYATTNGTAIAGQDYQTKTGTLTFKPGKFTKNIKITVMGDKAVEPDETFFVNLSNATNVVIGASQGTGTILNDDQPPPSISIGGFSANEGDSGTSILFAFTVTLSAASNKSITVNYATANGTATTGNADYVAKSGTLTFQAGQTTKNVKVKVKGDNAVELDETFFVNLSSPTKATIEVGQGVGTILNDDIGPLGGGRRGDLNLVDVGADTPRSAARGFAARRAGEPSSPAVLEALFGSRAALAKNPHEDEQLWYLAALLD